MYAIYVVHHLGGKMSADAIFARCFKNTNMNFKLFMKLRTEFVREFEWVGSSYAKVLGLQVDICWTSRHSWTKP